MARLWYQVICASTACTIGSSGHASANARMYFRFRGESPFMSGNDQFQVLRQPIDHIGTPPFTFLPIENTATSLPVQQDQFTVDGERCAQLRRLNPRFQLGEKLAILAIRVISSVIVVHLETPKRDCCLTRLGREATTTRPCRARKRQKITFTCIHMLRMPPSV